MSFTLLIHIGMGAIALASGTCALLSQKGTLLHRTSGNIFFVSMLTMAISAATIALYKQRPDSIISGLLTFYLVLTAWTTIRKADKQTGLVEVLALIFIAAISWGAIAVGWEAAESELQQINGFPPAFYYFQGSLAGFFAMLDINVLIRGGISGRQRISRHIWRMCLALLIATASFVGQPRIIPDALKDPLILSAPVILIFATMIFWIVRVRFTNWLDMQSSKFKGTQSDEI